jgi:hypothetical protein
MAYQQSLMSSCKLEEDLYVALAAEGHALLKKLLYAPKLVPELLGVASACKRLPELVQIGARASVVFRSLGTRPANLLRRAILQLLLQLSCCAGGHRNLASVLLSVLT